MGWFLLIHMASWSNSQDGFPLWSFFLVFFKKPHLSFLRVGLHSSSLIILSDQEFIGRQSVLKFGLWESTDNQPVTSNSEPRANCGTNDIVGHLN